MTPFCVSFGVVESPKKRKRKWASWKAKVVPKSVGNEASGSHDSNSELHTRAHTCPPPLFDYVIQVERVDDDGSFLFFLKDPLYIPPKLFHAEEIRILQPPFVGDGLGSPTGIYFWSRVKEREKTHETHLS